MYYSYSAIFRCGVMNIFGIVIHLGYLCMKLPTTKGIIVVYDDQDSARAAESTTTLGQKNVHNLSKEKSNNKESLLEELRPKTESNQLRKPKRPHSSKATQTNKSSYQHSWTARSKAISLNSCKKTVISLHVL